MTNNREGGTIISVFEKRNTRLNPCPERESVGKIPDALRKTIARNITQCRQAKYPGRGGCKQCSEEFGVSPQQWSPWETGKRTPDEIRLSQLAEFFGESVEWMRTDHRPQTPPDIPSTPDLAGSGEAGRSHSTRPPPFPPAPAGTAPFSCPPCCPLLATWTETDQRRLLWIMEKYMTAHDKIQADVPF